VRCVGGKTEKQKLIAVAGKLYLVPVTLGEESRAAQVLPEQTLLILHTLKEFVVENEKSARHFLKHAGTPFPMQELVLHPIGKHVSATEMTSYLDAAKKGGDIGLLSEAGCPGVADPGAEIVRMAHEAGIQVVPLVGPSSLLLALMASGMNGQQFKFHGYLPIDKGDRQRYLKNLERETKQSGTTHLFIETPFRNKPLIDDLFRTLESSTLLCIACDLTLPTEYVVTAPVAAWKKKQLPDLHKRPAVFLIGS
jgi:16S rRNA (cytidine1402-2'-O)-methyltransferase